MTVKRRMAPENAATRVLLMDSVESLMREQGYAAVSARAVAALSGLKYPTIFYYFESMDDLLLGTYRRRTQNVLDRTEAALNSDRPLHALWSAASDPFDAAMESLGTAVPFSPVKSFVSRVSIRSRRSSVSFVLS